MHKPQNAFGSLTRARTHLEPVPIRYVLVPCRVCGAGLQPNMRMTRDDNCSIRGIMVFAIIFLLYDKRNISRLILIIIPFDNQQ